MDKDFIIELTNKLYKLTLLFPKKEPLRYKIREVADEILTNTINWESLNSSNPGKYAAMAGQKEKETIFTLEKDLEVINSFFEIAKWQNWINYFDILEIQEEYGKIKSNLAEEIKRIEVIGVKENINKLEDKTLDMGPIESKNQMAKEAKLEPRKEKIIKILKRIERIQVGEINKLFPDVSKRTIRRDFQKMLKQGIIERMGEKNNTFYRIKPSETANF